MDPIQERWMYESWLRDQEEEIDRLRHHGILVGSFFNNEAARQMISLDKPTYQSTDDETDQVMGKVLKGRQAEEAAKQAEQSRGHRRKRRKPINKDI